MDNLAHLPTLLDILDHGFSIEADQLGPCVGDDDIPDSSPVVAQDLGPCVGDDAEENCLLEDSLLLGGSGREICIRDVAIGEMVLAIDPISGRPTASRVTNVLTNHWRKAYYVINGCLRITNDHPVIRYRNGAPEWVVVEAVQVGDIIAGLEGSVEVREIRSVSEGAMTVYLETDIGNFVAIGGNDTYLVSGNYANAHSLMASRQAA